MDDLVERLRTCADSDMVPMEKVMYLLIEAADALEAVLDEVDTLQDELDYLRQVKG